MYIFNDFCRIDLVHIPGKKSRVVPMLIMPNIKVAMDQLVSTRQENHLSSENSYFFASSSTGGHLSQFKVLARVAKDAKLNKPELVRSTKLRKYLATMAQVSIFTGKKMLLNIFFLLLSSVSINAEIFHMNLWLVLKLPI